jgi:hypothetical protein
VATLPAEQLASLLPKRRRGGRLVLGETRNPRSGRMVDRDVQPSPRPTLRPDAAAGKDDVLSLRAHPVGPFSPSIAFRLPFMACPQVNQDAALPSRRTVIIATDHIADGEELGRTARWRKRALCCPGKRMRTH